MTKKLFKMKKIKIISAITLLVILIMMSCSKSPKCWGDNKNKGCIVDNFEWPDCYSAKASSGNSYVIRSSDNIDTLDNCNSTPFPVDFSQHSIIAQSVSGQCNIKVIRELIIDDSNKQYNYKITVKECGHCKKAAIDKQFVLVPAIPDDYSVNFDVEVK